MDEAIQPTVKVLLVKRSRLTKQEHAVLGRRYPGRKFEFISHACIPRDSRRWLKMCRAHKPDLVVLPLGRDMPLTERYLAALKEGFRHIYFIGKATIRESTPTAFIRFQP